MPLESYEKLKQRATLSERYVMQRTQVGD